MQRLLAERIAGPSLGESELEGRAFRVLRAAGLPDPVAQFRVRIAGAVYVLDMAYPQVKVGIELDGWTFHGSRSAFDADRVRGNVIRNSGWHILQFTSRTSDAELADTVAEALVLRGWPTDSALPPLKHAG
jgi:very-short-patch-repair endonuclease